MKAIRRKIVIGIMGSILLAISVAQAVPHQISYQGKLMENGQPATGTKNIVFTIGAWSQTNSVLVENGLYSVTLGSQTPLPSSAFSGDTANVQITVEGTALPTTALLSVPYAYQAEIAAIAASASNATKIAGQTVSTTAPTSSGQVLKWSGSQWEPGADNAGGTETDPFWTSEKTNYSTTATADGRYVNAIGDTMTGSLTINSNLVVSGIISGNGAGLTNLIANHAQYTPEDRATITTTPALDGTFKVTTDGKLMLKLGTRWYTFVPEITVDMAQNNSLDLAASSGQYAGITDSSQTGLDITGDMTIECWYNFKSHTNTHFFVSKWKGADNNRSYRLDWIENHNWPIPYSLRWNTCDNGLSEVVKAVTWMPTDGIWYHIAVTYDASAGSCIFYINGVQVGTTQTGLKTSLYNSTANVLVGREGDDSPASSDGLIKDVRIFDDIRTPSEIRADAYTRNVNDANLQAEWNFNNSYKDTSGHGNTLTPSGSPVFSTNVPYSDSSPIVGAEAYWKLNGNSVEEVSAAAMTDCSMTFGTSYGKVNEGAHFDGTTAKYTYPNSATFAELGTSDFTINMWVKVPSWSANSKCMMGKEATEAHNSYIRYQFTSSGTVLGFAVRGLNGAWEDNNTVTITPPSTDTWHMLTVKRVNADAKLYYYIDNIAVGNVSINVVHSYSPYPDNGWSIGTAVVRAGTDYAPFRWNGDIDEVGIWLRALSTSELTELYNGGNGL